MEPLCQTQAPPGGHDTLELLNRLETQETKVLESEQRCRKAVNDLQKSEERRQAFENDAIALRKQIADQSAKHQRILSERDTKINMLIEQFRHIDLSNKKDEQIKTLQIKLAEYRNVELIYKGLANSFKSELHKLIGSDQSIQDKDRIIEELIRYNVILKEEHSKMADDKQDLMRNLDRVTAQCEKMQLDKRQALKRQTNAVDNDKQELAAVQKQLESYQARVGQLEALLLRTASPDTGTLARRLLHESPMSSSVSQQVRARLQPPPAPVAPPVIDDETSNEDDTDSNMIDLTNVVELSSPPRTSFSTQQFSSPTSAIHILHSIIQDTTTCLDLPTTSKKMKVRKLNDETEENEEFLVRPFVVNKNNFKRTFDKFGGHSAPMFRRTTSSNSSTTFKSKSRVVKPKTAITKNNHKITTFFDMH